MGDCAYDMYTRSLQCTRVRMSLRATVRVICAHVCVPYVNWCVRGSLRCGMLTYVLLVARVYVHLARCEGVRMSKSCLDANATSCIKNGQAPRARARNFESVLVVITRRSPFHPS